MDLLYQINEIIKMYVLFEHFNPSITVLFCQSVKIVIFLSRSVKKKKFKKGKLHVLSV